MSKLERRNFFKLGLAGAAIGFPRASINERGLEDRCSVVKGEQVSEPGGDH